jgi:hypothetical protein
MSIPSIEMQAGEDLSLNDLHYKIDRKINRSKLSKEIILINTGSLSVDNFRGELAELLLQIDSFNPKVIGVDHDFDDDTTRFGTEELLNSIEFIPNIVLARNGRDTSKKMSLSKDKLADVSFPEYFNSVRRYYSNESTFASKIASIFKPGLKSDLVIDSFIINYVGHDFFELKRSNFREFLFTNDYSNQFPMIQSSDILSSSNYEKKIIKKLLNGKIILLGHLGNTCLTDFRNDSEDKFAVPCDSNMLFRSKTMNGLLIHANAIENLINPECRFNVLSDQLWFLFLEELLILLYLYFLLFAKAGKLINILLMLGLSLPVLYLTLYFMQNNIYIEMGTTLLQLLLFEELVEIIEPLYFKIKSFLSLNKEETSVVAANKIENPE